MPPSTFSWNRCIFGDCRDVMRDLAAQGVRVQTCVTSPPYWGLRDYGHAGQLGLEPTPEDYVTTMVEVFHCLRDILADDGTLWLNLGDSYAGGKGQSGQLSAERQEARADDGQSLNQAHHQIGGNGLTRPTDNLAMLRIAGLKPKDLTGIPWSVAFALREDGWWLRQDIIWAKPNPMPESVRDRCTKSHEYVFLLAKSEDYYFDQVAIAEKSVGEWNSADWSGGKKLEDQPAHIQELMRTRGLGTHHPDQVRDTRNKRSVWTVPTRSYKGAHFATYPPELIEPCIMAGTSERGHCPKCGARWERIVDRQTLSRDELPRDHQEYRPRRYEDGKAGDPQGPGAGQTVSQVTTLCWQPGCRCGLEPVPDAVFDPFFGSDTTGEVAQRLGRLWLGSELNPDYESLQRERTAQQGLMF